MLTGLMVTGVVLCVGVTALATAAPSESTTRIEAGRVAYAHTSSFADAASEQAATDDARTVAGAATREIDFEDRASNVGPKRFLEAGSLRLNLFGAYGDDFDDAQQFGGGAALSFFLVDGFSVDLELGGLGFSQDGSDAVGANLNILFRWHFFERERWTVYGDAGAGILLTTNDVPSDGTSFNFTPQIGLGASWEVRDDIHLMAGIRWFHISNARTSSNNPARDSLQVYVGISLPLR